MTADFSRRGNVETLPAWITEENRREGRLNKRQEDFDQLGRRLILEGTADIPRMKLEVNVRLQQHGEIKTAACTPQGATGKINSLPGSPQVHSSSSILFPFFHPSIHPSIHLSDTPLVRWESLDTFNIYFYCSTRWFSPHGTASAGIPLILYDHAVLYEVHTHMILCS